MTNEEHLQFVKKQDKDYIRLAKKEKEYYKTHGYSMYDYPSKDRDKKAELMSADYRKIKALEIIAETLMKIDSKMDDMMTSDGRLKVIDIFHG